MKMEFNDKIIDGYLCQLIKQLDLRIGQDKILNKGGGLAYSLFTYLDRDSGQYNSLKLRLSFNLESKRQFEGAEMYYNTILDYLDNCQRISLNFGFGLVKQHGFEAFEVMNHSVYYACIGKSQIKTVKEIKDFVKMLAKHSDDYLSYHQDMRARLEQINKEYRLST